MEDSMVAKKNVLLGFSLIFWPLALVLLITGGKDYDKAIRKILIESLIFEAFFIISTCIPFLGWAFEIFLLVIFIMKIVQVFCCNYDKDVLLVSLLSKKFIGE